MIGQQISPVLVELENTLWEWEANTGSKPEYTQEGFRAGIKIFMSVLLDRIYELQEDEKIEFPDRCNMAQKAGEEVRKLVKTFTNIDTIELYKT